MTYKELIKILKHKKQVFLTGAAGTGKSYIVNELRRQFSGTVTLSSTNLSAQLIGGDTVHYFFRLGICKSFKELEGKDNSFIKWFCHNVYNNPHKAKESLYRNMTDIIRYSDLIIIDEVSMLSANILDFIYYRLNVLKSTYGITIPPILFVGDLFQLPPVTKDNEPTKMIFESRNWKPYIIELTKFQRTDEIEFMRALKNIRVGKYTKSFKELIDNTSPIVSKEVTVLSGVNRKVNKINKEKLMLLDSDLFTFEAEIDTQIKDKSKIEQIIKNFTTPKTLHIKKGCPVLFTNTNKDEGWVNGAKGTVKEIQGNTIIVKAGEKEFKVGRQQFVKNKLVFSGDITEYIPELIMLQFPLRLAYAITIHKSQGMTLQEAKIDCSDIFEGGQFYVALSRVKSFKNVVINGFNSQLIRNINQKAKEYYDNNKGSINYIEEVTKDTEFNIELEEEELPELV